jgi:ribosomal protein S15P/S13E
VFVGIGLTLSGLALLHTATKNKDLEEIVMKAPKGREMLDFVLEIELKQAEFQNKITELGNTIYNQLEATKNTVTGAIESTKNTVTTAIDDISNAVVSTKDSVTQTVTGATDAVFTSVTNVKEGISNTIKSMEDTAEKTVESAKDKYNSVLGLVAGAKVESAVDPGQKVEIVQIVQPISKVGSTVQPKEEDVANLQKDESSKPQTIKVEDATEKPADKVVNSVIVANIESVANESAVVAKVDDIVLSLIQVPLIVPTLVKVDSGVPAKVEPVIDIVAAKIEPVVDVVVAKIEPVVDTVAAKVEPVVDVVVAIVEPVADTVVAKVEPVVDVVVAKIEPVGNEVAAKVDSAVEVAIKSVPAVDAFTKPETSKPTESEEKPKGYFELKVAETIQAESKNIEASLSDLSSSMKAVGKSLETDVQTKAGRPLQELIETMESVSDKLVDLSKDNCNKEELLKTEGTIRGLAKYLEHLEADEAIRLSMALIEQTLYFQTEMEALKIKAEKAISDNSERLSAKFSDQVIDDRKETQKAAEDFLTITLDGQAELYKQALHNHLEQQQKDLNEFWKQEVKKAVDDEKDLRLQRLDYLTLKLKYLQRISLDTSDHLSRQNQITTLQNTLNAINRKLETSSQNIEREFLLLKRVGKNDQLTRTVLESVDLKTYMPRDELIDMFHGIKDQLYNNQLTPNDGSVLTFMVSRAMAKLLVPKKGLVPGSDTNAILARIEYFIQRGDFEQACREGNMLKGWSRVLANDWLVGLRGYLNIKQCVDVLETRVKLQGLGVIQ